MCGDDGDPAVLKCVAQWRQGWGGGCLGLLSPHQNKELVPSHPTTTPLPPLTSLHLHQASTDFTHSPQQLIIIVKQSAINEDLKLVSSFIPINKFRSKDLSFIAMHLFGSHASHYIDYFYHLKMCMFYDLLLSNDSLHCTALLQSLMFAPTRMRLNLSQIYRPVSIVVVAEFTSHKHRAGLRTSVFFY